MLAVAQIFPLIVKGTDVTVWAAAEIGIGLGIVYCPGSMLTIDPIVVVPSI